MAFQTGATINCCCPEGSRCQSGLDFFSLLPKRHLLLRSSNGDQTPTIVSIVKHDWAGIFTSILNVCSFSVVTSHLIFGQTFIKGWALEIQLLDWRFLFKTAAVELLSACCSTCLFGAFWGTFWAAICCQKCLWGIDSFSIMFFHNSCFNVINFKLFAVCLAIKKEASWPDEKRRCLFRSVTLSSQHSVSAQLLLSHWLILEDEGQKATSLKKVDDFEPTTRRAKEGTD